MPIVRRWWQKYRLNIFLGFSAVAIALFIFQTKGSIITETFATLSRKIKPYSESERKIVLTNAFFQELQNQITQLESENKQLKQLLKYQQKSKNNLITAPVVARSADSWWQLVTIGVGSKQGIKKDDTVTGIGGLVGRIVEVTPNTSRVLLISDSTSRVGTTINRTRYMGFIKGDSSQTATMVFYAKVSDVKIGDMVTTSSVSTIFPPGIPIGKVVSIDLDKSPAPEATIKFSAPIDFLEWVTVISNK